MIELGEQEGWQKIEEIVATVGSIRWEQDLLICAGGGVSGQKKDNVGRISCSHWGRSGSESHRCQWIIFTREHPARQDFHWGGRKRASCIGVVISVEVPMPSASPGGEKNLKLKFQRIRVSHATSHFWERCESPLWKNSTIWSQQPIYLQQPPTFGKVFAWISCDFMSLTINYHQYLVKTSGARIVTEKIATLTWTKTAWRSTLELNPMKKLRSALWPKLGSRWSLPESFSTSTPRILKQLWRISWRWKRRETFLHIYSVMLTFDIRQKWFVCFSEIAETQII